MAKQVSMALIHWPVRDKAGNIVATNITNFDIHDIARCCRTYGVHKYFIVNRLQEQLFFVSRLLDYWKVGAGAKLNHMRRTALGMIELEETLESLLSHHYPDKRPFILATAARNFPGHKNYSFKEVKELITAPGDQDILILFGTGFGLDEKVLFECDGLIEPIRGASEDDYRHLSVRSAVSICLDRLLGTW